MKLKMLILLFSLSLVGCMGGGGGDGGTDVGGGFEGKLPPGARPDPPAGKVLSSGGVVSSSGTTVKMRARLGHPFQQGTDGSVNSTNIKSRAGLTREFQDNWPN